MWIPDMGCGKIFNRAIHFGYKICWYAISNETSESVIEKLKLKIISESNWENGINHVYNSSKHLFVSPVAICQGLFSSHRQVSPITSNVQG